MRIALLTAGVRGIGSYCLNLYHRLTAEGHQVLLISERPWEKQRVESFYQARSVMLFGMAPVVYRPRKVVQAIADFQPDLIHHHWPCGTMDFLFGMVAKLGVPYVVTVHVSLASKQHILDRFWYSLFTVYRRWMHGACAVNCISEFVRGQLNERVHLPDDRLHRIYAGIDEQIFRPGADRPQPRAGERPPVELLFVGQIMPEKGVDMLVRAFVAASRLRDDLRLTIVGKGPLEKRLRKLSVGVPAVKWVGFLTGQHEIARYYAAADATILPTRWDEAFSLVPIESFACGTPVIATARGGTLEQVFDGETGYLLHEGTAAELTDLLVGLDRDDLRAMRARCRQLVMERHTLEQMGARHVSFYRTAIERAGRNTEKGR